METMFYYTAEDFSPEELERLNAEFERRYGQAVESALQKVLHHERATVLSITSRASHIDEDDLRQTLRLKVYQHAPWLIRKSHLDPNRNIQGFFYSLMRNALIDVARRVARRAQTEISYETLDHQTLGGDCYDVVEAKSELESAVMVLLHRLQHVESLLIQSDPEAFLQYLCWWLNYRADYLSGQVDPSSLTESELRPITALFEPDR